jgi:uncharacterized protein (TIGR03437 family)
LILLAIAAAAVANAQWDNSGNGMLNGTYYFRQMVYVIGYANGQLGEAVSMYGNINFDGNGNWTITTADKAVVYDTSQGAGALTGSGTYTIAASGYGFLSSPLNLVEGTSDVVYGMVSAQGIFVGSSTETTYGYNDMMIAAPVASPLPNASSFTGSWVCADFDFSSGSPTSALSLTFPLSPNGVSSLGTVGVTGYYGGGGATLLPTQTSSVTYTFSNGAAVANFPTNGEYVSGSKYLYFSPDGNFLFGGSPYNSNTPFDMIVGVKTSAGTPTAAGKLYYQAGIDEVYNGSVGNLDTYYGSVYAGTGAAPPCAEPLASTCLFLLGHQRVNDFGDILNYGSLSDYTFNDSISPVSGVYTNAAAHYVIGDGGAVMITAGVGPYMGISVGVQAPCAVGAPYNCQAAPCTGVCLSPTGVVNSASNAPFTAGIAPGELLTLYGTNLAAALTVAATADASGNPISLPKTLGGVQVTIGGLPAAIYYVSPTQVSAIVPYSVTGPIVPVYVTNNQVQSNTVTEYLNATAPGVFTQNQNGTGYGAILHLGIGNSVAAAYSEVSDTNPAVLGETLAVFLTGLGAVSPTIADGATGPSSTFSNAINTVYVYFGADVTAVTPSYAGLAPGLDALYQINVTVPASGLTAGAADLEIVGGGSDMAYMLIPLTTTAGVAVTAADAKNPATTGVAARLKVHKPGSSAPRRLPIGK